MKFGLFYLFIVLFIFSACLTHHKVAVTEEHQTVTKVDTQVVKIIKTEIVIDSSFDYKNFKYETLGDKDIENMIENSQIFARHLVGFVLFDPEKDKTICEVNSTKYFQPASTTKLFTLYSALKILRDSVPALKYEIHGDSLIFTGTGDPSFLMHYFWRFKNTYNFLKHTPYKLYYVQQSRIDNFLGKGWAWDDYNEEFSAERSDLPVYGNLARFELVKKSKKMPKVTPSTFKDAIRPHNNAPLVNGPIIRRLTENIYDFYPNLINGRNVFDIPFKYSPKLLTKLLSDTLNRDVELISEYDKFTKAKTFYSMSIDTLLKRMMLVSDNFIAEQTMLMCSGVLYDTLRTERTIYYVNKNLINDLPDKQQWVDGSGLSRYNLVTPRNMVYLLRKLYRDIPTQRLLNLFPVGGVSGTIKNYYKNKKPYVYAKTGTFSNNHNLCGYIRTKSGKILIFSFMHNNFMCPVSSIKHEMEKILLLIYWNY